MNKFLPMTGVEPRTSGIESNRSTNWATTTAQNIFYNIDPRVASKYCNMGPLPIRQIKFTNFSHRRLPFRYIFHCIADPLLYLFGFSHFAYVK